MLDREQLNGKISEEEKENELKEIIIHSHAAMKYLYNNIAEIYDNAMNNSVKKVITTLGYELGIACPDIINHRVIRGNKKGRIIKAPPKNKDYSEAGYDEKNDPLYFRCISAEFGGDHFNFYLFFGFDGFSWAARMETIPGTLDIIRYKSDEKGRILEYTHTDGAHYDDGGKIKNKLFCHAGANRYEYPDDPEAPIICRSYCENLWYYPSKSIVLPVIVPGHPNGGVYNERCYEISPDHKNISCYVKDRKSGEFRLSGVIKG